MTFTMDTVGSRPGKSGYGDQSHSCDGDNQQVHGEDGLLQDARKLCELFKKQESVTSEINASLTDMCMQLVSENASQVRKVAVPMPVCVPGPAEVPCVSRGQGRGKPQSGGEGCNPGDRMVHGRACSATGISAVGCGGHKTLFRACATAEEGAVGRGVPETLSTVGSVGSVRPSTVSSTGSVRPVGHEEPKRRRAVSATSGVGR